MQTDMYWPKLIESIQNQISDRQLPDINIDYLFDLPDIFWSKLKKNNVSFQEAVFLIISLVDRYTKLETEKQISQFSFYPVLIVNDIGIQTGVLSDLVIQELKDNQPELMIFSAFDLLSKIHQ